MHSFRVRVYFSDTDAGGIVYHARYLDFAEHARTEMLRESLPDASERGLSELGILFVVRSITIEYLSPAYLDDDLTVYTSVETLGTVSAVLKQEIKRENELLAVLKVKVGLIYGKNKKPMKIPDNLKKAISVFAE